MPPGNPAGYAKPNQQLAKLMGRWQVKGNKKQSAQNFAAARMALIQAALARGFGQNTASLDPATSAWAPQYNALMQYLAQPQTNQANPMERYRDVSALFGGLSSSMGQGDPRQFLLAMMQGRPGQYSPGGGL